MFVLEIYLRKKGDPVKLLPLIYLFIHLIELGLSSSMWIFFSCHMWDLVL